MKDAEFMRKTDKAFALMSEKGLRKSLRAPFTYRLVWSLGLKVRPALFASFGINVLFLGVFFAVTYGVIMWFVSWRPHGWSPETSIITSIIAGLFYGICIAAKLRNRRKIKGLPVWEEL